MKRILLVLLGVTLLFSCSKEQTKKIDLVNDLDPVHRLNNDHTRIMAAIVSVPDDEKMDYINEHWPTLANDVVYWIKSYPGHLPEDARISNTAVIDSTVLFYGSGEGIANDNKMKKYEGEFTGRLIAAIYIHGDVNNPHLYFVECVNGLVISVESKQNVKRLGRTNNDFEFTIASGEGLCHHVSYETSIMMAESFALPLYRGRNQLQSKRITYAEGRSLRGKTDQIQVTVQVYEGDHFNLNTGVYTPAKR